MEQKQTEISDSKIPKCIGIILDGNRRWARSKGLPTFEGHRVGYKKCKELFTWTKNAGIKNLIVYGLSTENLKRSEEEVGHLLNLFRTVLKEELEGIMEEGVRIISAGDTAKFPQDIQNMLHNIQKRSENNTPLTFVIGAPYGGRAEIIQAVNKLLMEGRKEITEEEFNKYLWTATVPDPDLIIRTGGEKRLSNFLPWQSTYSELFFTDTYWPEFSEEEFLSILAEFTQRDRRRGK